MGSPLDPVAGHDATHATEAFAALGDETRLAILLALWEACDPPTRTTECRSRSFASASE